MDIKNNLIKNKIKTVYFIGIGNDKYPCNANYLRGKQIADKLKVVYNLNIITTPSNLILKLNPNNIYNSIIFLIKKTPLKSEVYNEELKIVEILKNNNNILIRDLIDCNYNIILKKKFFYDIYLTCNNSYKKFLENKLINKAIYNIPHHLDSRLNNIDKKKIQQIKLIYIGASTYRNETNCYFISKLIKDYNLHYIKWNAQKNIVNHINEISKFNVHVDIRNEKDINYKVKPGTKAAIASAFNSVIITTKHPGAYELLGPDYPYYCDCNYNSVKNTVNIVKETFNKKEWYSALNILKNVKKEVDINNIIKYYYNLIYKYS